MPATAGGDPLSIFLENYEFFPGQTINGRVDCYFPFEDKVRGITIHFLFGIRVRFKGKTKVYFREYRTNYHAVEKYFEMECDLLKGQTTFQPGKYSYAFSFNLPSAIPPSLSEKDGNINYSVTATVDRPWVIDDSTRRTFRVHSLINLNNVDHAKNPVEITQTTIPFALLGGSGPIAVTVRLPIRGYVPSQMVAFTATVKNESKIKVQEIHFSLVQGFVFRTTLRTKYIHKVKGQQLSITDSLVEAGEEKLWNLELRVPEDVFVENLYYCRAIDSYFELQGEVILPFPHSNLKIAIPLTLGSLPLQVPASQVSQGGLS